ncbi:MAG: hypothetical protein M3Z23_16840 [Acidobacteriota bacterium]|nr:hypothetical protein [Acidobacteriota bacterium]
MAGYLDQYGTGDERRETLVKRIVIFGILGIVIIGLAYYIFKNHAQERVAKDFLQRLRKQDYAGAYTMWGCSQAKPCDGYSYEKFLEDWGPKTTGADLAVLALNDSESCGKGVILTVDVNPSRQEKLWVEKDNPILSFSPVPVCPHKGSFSILLHRTAGKLRKPFLK